MNRSGVIAATSKRERYADLALTLAALLAGERDWIANLANVSALLMQELGDVNWAGFYLLKDGELVLGPFQGKPACVRIALGKGVCGTAAERRASIVVRDVHEFPGHIACDAASQSEIVVPLFDGDNLIGVWDVDSPDIARFDDEDRIGMERLAGIFVDAIRAGS